LQFTRGINTIIDIGKSSNTIIVIVKIEQYNYCIAIIAILLYCNVLFPTPGGETWVAENENEVFEIKTVSHMGTYIHQMIQEQVAWLKEQKKRNVNH
jgi:DNA polymerase II small subunit/DNA polymerase delta subunit B